MGSPIASQLSPELGRLYEHWLAELPANCRPHFYNLSHRHRVVFVLQTPLKRQLPERNPVAHYIHACRKILLEWMSGKGDVWSQIASSLPASIAGTTVRSLEDLLAITYFTDCIKCESTDKDIQEHRKHTSQCLRDELSLLEEAVLFITVGGEAWDTIRDLVGPLSPVQYSYQHLRHPLPTNLTNVHGVLFENASTGQFVIPLTFPGGQTNALRNSYVEYLREGLAALADRLNANAPSCTSIPLLGNLSV